MRNSVYRKWISDLEWKGFSKHASFKTTHDFDWGLKYLGLNEDSNDPVHDIMEYTRFQIEHSDSYFIPPKLNPEDYNLENGQLSFPSSIRTHIENNNTARMELYPAKNSENIIIVVPHWNAPSESYDKICRLFQKINFSSLRVNLPYHRPRDNGEEESSTLMVSANIGMTIQAMQQSVRDILSAVNWLELQGYKRIGIMGSSIGSCCAFLAACHDRRINGFFANLMSSYFGDVVWTGLSTHHIKDSIDDHNSSQPSQTPVTQRILHDIFMLNSPVAFVDKIRIYNHGLKQFIVSARYDTTFLFELTGLQLNAYKEKGIPYSCKVLPCGHYSLGKSVFKYIDAFYIYLFFKKLFKEN